MLYHWNDIFLLLFRVQLEAIWPPFFLKLAYLTLKLIKLQCFTIFFASSRFVCHKVVFFEVIYIVTIDMSQNKVTYIT